jgi:hypothetical protein
MQLTSAYCPAANWLRAAKWIWAILVLWLAGAAAAAPVNDRCSGAEPIPPGPFPHFTAVSDITLATTNGDPPEASCLFVEVTNLSRSVWYTFVPSNTAFYSISTCADAPTATTVEDTFMAIYVSAGGCAGPFTQIPTTGATDGCEDDSCGPQFRQAALTTRLNADATYYIVVWQFGNTAPPAGKSSIQLRVTTALPPENDTCSTATELFLNKPMFGTTLLANNDYQLSGSSCFTGVGQRSSIAPGRDVVYSFRAPAAGAYSFKGYNYNNAVGYNLVMYVASSCPAGTSPLTVTGCLGAANRNPATSFEEVLCVSLAADQQVFVFVDDDEPDNAGSNFSIEVNACYRETEPNNTPGAAGRLPCPVSGTISSSSDLDYFALGAFPPDSRVFAMIDGNAANIPDFDLRITTMTNTLEYDERDNDPLFGDSSANVAGTPLTGGPAFVQVDGGSPTEPYRLYAVVQPPLAAATPESEPNNSFPEANAANNNYFYGSLAGPAPSTDADIYAFFADENDLIFLSLDGDPLRNNTPVDAKLELLDADGNVLVTVDDDNSISSTNMGTSLVANFPSSPGEALLYRSPAEASYFVRVSLGTGALTLAGAGDYLLSIARNCYAGNTGRNTAPNLGSLTITSPITENESATLNGTIIDPDVGEAFQVIIDWGDGSAMTTNAVLGPNSFSLSHQYLDDRPSDTPSDSYTVNAQVFDRFGNTAIGNASLTVQNDAPSNINLSGGPINENDTLTLSGSFTDAGTLDPHAVMIDWGDGSPTTTLNLSAGVLTFNADHQYRDDNPSGTDGDFYTITVSVADDDTGTGSGNTALRVNNVAPLLSNVAITSPIFPNETVILTGNMSDIGTQDSFTLMVDWGDGTSVATFNYGAGASSFNVSHQYQVADTNATVNLTLRDDDMATTTTNATITIKPRPVSAHFGSLAQLPNGHILLRLEGTAGATYRIETSANLTSWSHFATRTADANGLFEIEDTTSPLFQKWFYRAVWP